MESLAIDIETYSSVDLKKSGVYRYVESLDFEILLFSYSYDGGPVVCVDLAQGEMMPDYVMEALTSPGVLKTAHNAAFERTCIGAYFMIDLPVEQWECTMAKASMLGLPLGLEDASKALNLQQEKSSTGKSLIRYFSIPCKPTKTNGQRTRNLPQHAPEKWEEYKAYNVQDVVVEQAIRDKISFFTIPPQEKKLWYLDQQINDRGVLMDPGLINRAIQLDAATRERLHNEAVLLTDLQNPNSEKQLKKWLSDAMEQEITTLKKTDIPDMLEQVDDETIKRVLEIRQEMAKSSIKKYTRMTQVICRDSRFRGALQYNGANRTGRWAGRLVQVQNLPKNELKDLDLARQLVINGDGELVEMLYGNVPDTLSQLLRTAFIAAPGHRLIPADFSAIEARVIAWLAGEKWRLNVFNTHGKIYEASASQMFRIPIEQITKGSDYRQKGKMSELALGFQGGPNAIIKIEISNKTPKDKRIPVDELPGIVRLWRQASPMICKLWETVGNAALEAVADKAMVSIQCGIRFFMEKGILFIQLPSGRKLAYLRPEIRDGKYGPALYYQGVDQTTKQWKLIPTYGGKLVENIVQGTARDILAESMLHLDDAGYKIVLHVHDEVVNEMPDGVGSIEDVNAIMSRPIPWAKGLPLKVESYETQYYKKD